MLNYFSCNEFNFKLNWYFCANTNDVKNFAVIKSVVVKRVDCINLKLFPFGLNLSSFDVISSHLGEVILP